MLGLSASGRELQSRLALRAEGVMALSSAPAQTHKGHRDVLWATAPLMKTPTFNLRVEIPSRFRKFENQKCLRPLLREEDRENNSAHSWLVHVFTQPGSVNNGPWGASELGPLIPQQRTCSDYCNMSAWCPTAEIGSTLQGCAKDHQLSDKRKPDPERRAAVNLISCRYEPMVRFNNGARDGQPHAHAFRLAGEKRFEDLF